MSRTILQFFLTGVLWIFLLSIPVGQGRTVYDLARYFLVDTAPVNWVAGQFSKTVAKTQSASEVARDNARDAFQQGQDRLSEYKSNLQLSE